MSTLPSSVLVMFQYRLLSFYFVKELGGEGRERRETKKSKKMGFWTLFEAASMPILQVLIIGGLGAFMATGYSNLLPADTRRSLNKVSLSLSTPLFSSSFLSYYKNIRTKSKHIYDKIADCVYDLHSVPHIILGSKQALSLNVWFMPINVGLTFLFGGIFGWIAVKLLKPEPHLEGLIIACCSAGNLGNLMLIIVPAICNEHGSPFGDHEACRSVGLSYSSFSMAVTSLHHHQSSSSRAWLGICNADDLLLGGFYIWTYTFHLVRSSSIRYQESMQPHKDPNRDVDADEKTQLLSDCVSVALPPPSQLDDTQNQLRRQEDDELVVEKHKGVHVSDIGGAHMFGLVFGAVPWLKGLIIGESAPFHVIQDCFQLLGNGTIPCITLILGGNLTQGFKRSKLKRWMILGVLVVKYLAMPMIGAGVVRAASLLGFLPHDPLYHFVLMIQFTLPPAMNIGTMAQLFDVGQEECSVLYLWTYLVAAFALTFWATVYMWILS
ncbi:LOW QUALITY PROTEIN: hypothetical protein V2J09_000324 [Rumex salicifolius]